MAKNKDDEESYGGGGGGYWDMVEDLEEEICFDAQEVIPNLYIGSISAATCTTSLKEHKITHILSISTNPPKIKEFTTLCINIEDESQKDISSYFQQCHGFIENGRKLGGILVHCSAGVSRSASVVISYLMSVFFKPFWYCMQYLRNIRPCIQPNTGFINQLINYEATILKNQNVISTTTTTTTTTTITKKKLISNDSSNNDDDNNSSSGGGGMES
ncbi:hypothetical protein ACTFIR_004767 [Dictyostelium discoideum]